MNQLDLFKLLAELETNGTANIDLPKLLLDGTDMSSGERVDLAIKTILHNNPASTVMANLTAMVVLVVSLVADTTDVDRFTLFKQLGVKCRDGLNDSELDGVVEEIKADLFYGASQ